MTSITFDEIADEGGIDWETLIDRVGDAPLWPALQEGNYLVEVFEAETGSNPRVFAQWDLKMRVSEGDEYGQPIWASVALDTDDENKTAVFFRISNCLGIPLAFYDSRPDSEAVAAQMVGRIAIVTVRDRVVDGTSIPSVVDWKPATT